MRHSDLFIITIAAKICHNGNRKNSNSIGGWCLLKATENLVQSAQPVFFLSLSAALSSSPLALLHRRQSARSKDKFIRTPLHLYKSLLNLACNRFPRHFSTFHLFQRNRFLAQLPSWRDLCFYAHNRQKFTSRVTFKCQWGKWCGPYVAMLKGKA